MRTRFARGSGGAIGSPPYGARPVVFCQRLVGAAAPAAARDSRSTGEQATCDVMCNTHKFGIIMLYHVQSISDTELSREMEKYIKILAYFREYFET